MSYKLKYQNFIFESYTFDEAKRTATFSYSFDSERFFQETITFENVAPNYNNDVFKQALELSFLLAGISYYKCFPTKSFILKDIILSNDQAEFFSKTYLHGLSQYLYENRLGPNSIGRFESTSSAKNSAIGYEADGLLALQSGGKDSLLLAELLSKKDRAFTPWYVTSGSQHPALIDKLSSKPLRVVKRSIDISSLKAAISDGGGNGHIPITYIIASYALLDAILNNESTLLTAIGREGEEAHASIENLPVMHQWSKTWQAEQLFSEYVHQNISRDIQVGSPLRGYSELKIAELFVKNCWEKFGHSFSSCNIANYTQGQDNQDLTWCGKCSKCANSFLLFAPWVEPAELEQLFQGNLFKCDTLEDIFRGLLAIDGIMKPFECVGEVEELRRAYHMARDNFPSANYEFSFSVPASTYDYEAISDSQPWTTQMIQ